MHIKQNNLEELKSLVAQFLPAHAVKSYLVKTIKVSQFEDGAQGFIPYLYHLETPVAVVNNWWFSSFDSCASGRFSSDKLNHIFVALNGVLYIVEVSGCELKLSLNSEDNSRIEMEKDICAKIKQLEDEIAALKKQINC